jgi:hypothetical protein
LSVIRPLIPPRSACALKKGGRKAYNAIIKTIRKSLFTWPLKFYDLPLEGIGERGIGPSN